MYKRISDFVDSYQEAFCVLLVILFIVLLTLFLDGCAILKPIGEFIFDGQKPPVIPPKTTNGFYELLYKADWLMTISVIALGIGTFVLARGNFIGLQVIIAALTIITALITFTKFTVWFGIIGLVLVVSLFGYVVYIHTKEKLNLNKAVQEIVTGIEKAKEIGEAKVKETLKTVFTKVVPQSESTKQIVETTIKNGNGNKNETKSL